MHMVVICLLVNILTFLITGIVGAITIGYFHFIKKMKIEEAFDLISDKFDRILG